VEGLTWQSLRGGSDDRGMMKRPWSCKQHDNIELGMRVKTLLIETSGMNVVRYHVMAVMTTKCAKTP
jgi:hypothetical protein